MSSNKIAILISFGLVILAGFLYYMIDNKEVDFAAPPASENVVIEQTWELPEILKEISGMAFMGENKIAAVQDEQGKIYIYNLKTKKIEAEIPFSGTGDYEGIAIKDNIAFVLRADGAIFRVAGFGKNPEVEMFKTQFSQEHDLEGIVYDNTRNELLISVKEKDPNFENAKGIYSFNLNTKTVDKEPVYKLELTDSVFAEIQKEEILETFKPSEIGVHPQTGKLFVLAANPPSILILNEEGTPENLFYLNGDDFPQAEGLTFSPDGTIYVSNEGEPATIHQISIKNSNGERSN